MKYQSELQLPEVVLPVLRQLEEAVVPNKRYRFMEFCGGHTHAFFKSGLIDLLPEAIEMVHGPGCPVCVLPSYPVENCIRLVEQDPNIALATYADLMRVPTASGDSLIQAKGRGAKILPLYSPDEALDFARDHPDKQVILLAIGFETTIPPTVQVLDQAVATAVDNFYVYCNHLNTAKALEYMLEAEDSNPNKLDGLIGPGHVSLVTGSDFFIHHATHYKRPIVISGFTPYDLAQSLLLLVKQVNSKRAEVEVEYSRAVTKQGNLISQELIEKYLELRPSYEWRGLGELPSSAFKLKRQWDKWDAEVAFDLTKQQLDNHPACLCPQVLTGKKRPTDCKLFGKACTPQSPLGPCMVSSEGACSAYYQAGRHL